MKDVNLIWALPFVAPFILVKMILAICMTAGVDPQSIDRGLVAIASMGIGGTGALTIAAYCTDESIKTSWNAIFHKETPNG